MKDYYEQLYGNTFDNRYDSNTFLERNKLPKLMQEKIKNVY